ncbi:hypothetical protein [Variovorax sp. KK3]|uniref:hypothetical protein n=1 Tax=Variovorax sp. KK3 TaxID=1855728 RepID=UPI00097C6EC6|nr:hypothetical protein [Variovorax sp. KK3]
MDSSPIFLFLVDAVIALTAAEAIVLVALHRLTGRGPRPGAYLLNLVSGLCLMAALRCALGDSGGVPWIALWLLAAGASHAADMWRRWVNAASARPRP